jgi:hypothetical protein
MALGRFRSAIKTLAKAILLLSLVLIVAIALGIYLVVTTDWTEKTEIVRIPSPDGKVTAILYETNGGATTSFGYRVYLEGSEISASPTMVAYTYGAIRNNRGAYGVMPRWVSNDELHIEYYSSLRDEVVSSIPRRSSKPIQIELKLNINDLSAPSGGMATNLAQKPS